jgi:hypothetical protein
MAAQAALQQWLAQPRLRVAMAARAVVVAKTRLALSASRALPSSSGLAK